MKIFEKNAIIKKIMIVLIVIIMTSNFIMPNYVHASVGDDLANGIGYLIAWLGDQFMTLMQRVMVGETTPVNKDNPEIKYSPGLIFANKVLPLDVNFIKPNNEKKTVTDTQTNEETNTIFSKTYSSVGGSSDSSIIYQGKSTNKSSHEGGEGTAEKRDELLNTYNYYIASDSEEKETSLLGKIYTWTNPSDNIKYQLVYDNISQGRSFVETIELKIIEEGNTSPTTGSIMEDANNKKLELLEQYGYNISADKKEDQNGYNYIYQWTNQNGNKYFLEYEQQIGQRDIKIIVTLKEIVFNSSSSSYVISSTAATLQKNISTWYVALRTIALVGLLSVLVYIGIRIILSSASAQDKAKYKNMLKDWLVAICILFVLHYVMAFMLQFNETLNGVFKNSTNFSTSSDSLSVDNLMTNIRKLVNDYDKVSQDNNIGYAIMYGMLVILTGVFTFHYLKRVIYMAFLTMIAPMIALTYPLDKIKDGKAQAFSFWLREYIFNCLIQPVHLMLYTMLIGFSTNIAETNYLFAIVALAFLVPAEKLIREMFGIKSNTSTGVLGAAAGGALVMSMLQKMKAKPPKEAADGGAGGGSSGAKGVRTATRNSSTSLPGGNPPPGNPPAGNPPAGNPPAGNPPAGNPPAGNPPAGNPPAGNPPYITTPTQARSIRNGLSAVKRSIVGIDSFKTRGKKYFKKALRGVGGVALGATTGTIGLTAGLATGDFSNAAKYAAAGASLGYGVGNNLTGTGINKAIETGSTFKKGYMGTEAYKNAKFDKEFYKSEDYRIIAQDSKLLSAYGEDGIKDRTQEFLDNGITDAAEIRKAMQSDISGDEYKAFSSLGIDKAKEMSRIKKLKTMDGRHYTPEMAAARKALAKNAPKNLPDFKAMMVGRTFDNTTVDDAMAERIFKEIVDFF